MNNNIDYENTYTVEIFKKDARISKRKGGRRFVKTLDLKIKNPVLLKQEMKKKYSESKKFIVEVNKTYVKRVNLMSGTEYWERFDTPHFCSPSSESYWSM
jgi:hypothetical protein